MEALKRRLDEAERLELSQGRTPPHTVSASTFISSAIQVEQEQYVPMPLSLNKTTNLPF